MPRNIMIVMDELEKVEPELKDSLDQIRNSVRYTAPEAMSRNWGTLMQVLTREAPPTHPKFKELLAICNGDKDGPCPA